MVSHIQPESTATSGGEGSAVRDLIAYALDSYWEELAFGKFELDFTGRQMLRELRVLARIANAELKALGADPKAGA